MSKHLVGTATRALDATSRPSTTYGFDPELEDEWTWSEKYTTQPEIRASNTSPTSTTSGTTSSSHDRRRSNVDDKRGLAH